MKMLERCIHCKRYYESLNSQTRTHIVRKLSYLRPRRDSLSCVRSWVRTGSIPYWLSATLALQKWCSKNATFETDLYS